jgi:outer membrane receptor protein involved in Fe transport
MRAWRAGVVIAVALAAIQQTCSVARAQSGPPNPVAQMRTYSGEVVDSQGAPVAAARVLNRAGFVLSVADTAGHFQLRSSSANDMTVRIAAEGFATTELALPAASDVRVVLEPELARESVIVTAYRAPLAQQASPASTRVLSAEELTEASSPVLDNKLRLVPGVELFRRSSSLVANPTSQGLSLRGLGSTAASRTLAVAEDVPLNDPYGGWIHWNELPELSLNSVEVVRGGASDLYGSSAIGGVVNMMLERPELNSVRFTSSYGGENTSDNSVLASTVRGRWSGLASGGILRTDGYNLIAPAARGPVDVPSRTFSERPVGRGRKRRPSASSSAAAY